MENYNKRVQYMHTVWGTHVCTSDGSLCSSAARVIARGKLGPFLLFKRAWLRENQEKKMKKKIRLTHTEKKEHRKRCKLGGEGGRKVREK